MELEIAGAAIALDPVLPSPDQIPEIGGDAKAKEEAAKQAELDDAKARADAEAELKEKRAAERAKHAAERSAAPKAEVKKTAAKVNKSELERIIEFLDRVHKRAS